MARSCCGCFLVGFFWCYEAIDSPVDTYLRIIAYTFAMFVLLNAIPIAAKWCLVGRWKAEVFPIWGLRYYRFWLVKSLVQSAPIIVFAGSPLYNLYLRLLGARIGPQHGHSLPLLARLHRSRLDRRQHHPAHRLRA